jgi:hypothetical protein
MTNQTTLRRQCAIRPINKSGTNPITFSVAETDDGVETLLDYLVEIAIQEVVEEARVACAEESS